VVSPTGTPGSGASERQAPTGDPVTGGDAGAGSGTDRPPAERLGATAGRVVLTGIGWGGTERSLSPRSMRAALLRYRIMAYTVGTGLVVLACIGVPLQYVGHNDAVVAVVGPIHGFAYIVYLAVAYDMARRVRWSLTKLVPVVLAGLVPGVAFVVERWTTPKIQAAIAEAEAVQAAVVDLGAAPKPASG